MVSTPDCSSQYPGFQSSWGGGAKVSCILCHWGVQLILAYSWARPAILVVDKGRGGECFYFFCFFSFIPVPLSSLFLSFISSIISSFSFLPFSGRQHKLTRKGWHVVKPQHNQSINPAEGGIQQMTIWQFIVQTLWLSSFHHNKMNVERDVKHQISIICHRLDRMQCWRWPLTSYYCNFALHISYFCWALFDLCFRWKVVKTNTR